MQALAIDEMKMLLIILLSIFAGPQDKKVIFINVFYVEPGHKSSIVTHMTIRDTEEGLIYYNQDEVPMMIVRPVAGKKAVYECSWFEESRTVVLSEAIIGFESLDLLEAQRVNLKLKDGSEIQLYRKSGLLYLIPTGENLKFMVRYSTERE